MSDANARERLDEKHDGDRERRIEAVKRWVDDIESEPPEPWGPQQNAVVDDQLDAARRVGTSASHRQRVRDVAAEILERRGGEDSE